MLGIWCGWNSDRVLGYVGPMGCYIRVEGVAALRRAALRAQVEKLKESLAQSARAAKKAGKRGAEASQTVVVSGGGATVQCASSSVHGVLGYFNQRWCSGEFPAVLTVVQGVQ